MLFEIQNGSVSVNGTLILNHINFEIKHREKIAIVGRNGAGKTTLLRLISGELDCDRDDKQSGPAVRMSRRLIVGMLRQHLQEADMDKTVAELFMQGFSGEEEFSRERFLYEMECDRLLTGFGLSKEEKQKKLSAFSGGEQTKIAMIHLLLSKPDILLLDEPTNHLDMESVQWLEEYLRNYDRAVIMVSHDRFFLDQVSEIVYELAEGHLTKYHGNYTEYKTQKRKQLALQKKQYEQQQEELKRLNDLIEKFKHKPKKAAFARSRKKIIERMELVPQPKEDGLPSFANEIIPEVPGSKWMLETEHLHIGYDGKAILEDITMRIKKGQKIGIIGPNGVGKTTFLKTVAEIIPPVKGKCTFGNRTVVGYFDQKSAEIATKQSVLEHYHSLFPALLEKDARKILGRYLFPGEKACIAVESLSGGEKARLCLCELLESRPNFLILDEPTNHMDIPAKETLEAAFEAYKGTMLFISHDRYFVSQVADAILVFEEGEVKYYPFGYDHYISRKRASDGNIAALVKAEDEALLSSMKAVPKAERHRLEEQDTEDAYLDWQFSLIKQQMRKAEAEYAKKAEQKEQLAEELQEHALEFHLVSEETAQSMLEEKQQALKTRAEEMEQLRQSWTKECLAWYDLWNDTQI